MLNDYVNEPWTKKHGIRVVFSIVTRNGGWPCVVDFD